jgi:hypothetical protein
MQSPLSAHNPAAAAVSPPPTGNGDVRARPEEEHAIVRLVHLLEHRLQIVLFERFANRSL